VKCSVIMVQGSGFMVQGLGFGVEGAGFTLLGSVGEDSDEGVVSIRDPLPPVGHVALLHPHQLRGELVFEAHRLVYHSA